MSEPGAIRPLDDGEHVTGLRSLLGWIGGIVLGAVLLFGAWAKILDPAAFAEQIGSEGLDFLLPAPWVATIAIALEVGLGFALVVGLRRRGVLVASGLLVVFFLFLTGRSYLRYLNGTLDDSHGCGCFGNLVQRTPAEAFWQDLFLLVPPWILAFVGRLRGAVKALRPRVAVTVLVTVAALVLAWLSPSLPLDDLATTVGRGVEVASLCTGGEDDRLCLDTLAPELTEGRHLVVVTELDAPGFVEGIDGLNALAMSGDSLIVLAEATLEESQEFFWTYGPSFETREAPASLLDPMARTFPRSFVVLDGVIVETHAGLPDSLPEGGIADPFGVPAGAAGDGEQAESGAEPTEPPTGG